MPRLYLVRHGEAAAGWDAHLDPGLSPLGRAQAEEAATRLAAAGNFAVVTSPLARARETAAPYAARVGATASVETAVAEIPSPGLGLADRRAWLMRLMAGTWGAVGSDLLRWRDGVVAALLTLPEDTAVFSHFIAINVAVGAARGEDAVVCFRPANASITVLESDGARLRLVTQGAEAASHVT